jgi:hypothetical protein
MAHAFCSCPVKPCDALYNINQACPNVVFGKDGRQFMSTMWSAEYRWLLRLRGIPFFQVPGKEKPPAQLPNFGGKKKR